jgi:hypothetical protein
MCHCNNRNFSASRFLSGFENNIPLSALEKGWESRRSTGFPNRHLRDSWAVGFWRTDHANQDDGCGLDDGFAGVQGVALATGDKGRDDKKFLSALHYFSVHNITWRAHRAAALI